MTFEGITTELSKANNKLFKKYLVDKEVKEFFISQEIEGEVILMKTNEGKMFCIKPFIDDVDKCIRFKVDHYDRV